MLGGVRLGRVRMGTIHSCGGHSGNRYPWGRYDESIFKRGYAMTYILIMVIFILVDL